jgi:predicted dehydrogenase
MHDFLGVAVIGAGMAGKAHAAAYRAAPTLYRPVLPPVRLVSIADANEPLAESTAARFGFERHDTSWQAIAAADDIDAVSVVVANSLHREMVEGLLAAGKHVLCEKPLSDNLDDARSMVQAAGSATAIARIGLTFRRSPGIAYIRDLIQSGRLGRVLHVSGRYWADYGSDPQAPVTWRYKGAAGSGVLADTGSHLTYLAEFLAGDVTAVRGGSLSTVIPVRPKPLGAVVGHQRGQVSNEREAVENDDVAAFSASFAGGATGTLQVSRVAAGHPNTLAVEVFCEHGSAAYDQRHPGEITLYLADGDSANAGYRTVILGPDHPYWRDGLPMDAAGVGIGQNEGFTFQARSFLEEVAGLPDAESLPRCARLEEGLHNMAVLAAVAASALDGGRAVTL